MTSKTKIYLDNCCFNRPFDDQNQIRIQIETEAKIHIQELILNNKISLVWSFILSYENAQNPYEERKRVIEQWRKMADQLVESSDDLIKKAKKLSEIGLNPKDCLHVASAIQGGCKFYLTTDDHIIKKMTNNKEIIVINPTDFITKYEEKYVN